MRFAIASIVLVFVSSCGSSSSAGDVSALIEEICRANAGPRGTEYAGVADSSSCSYGWATAGNGSRGFCTCSTTADCPTGLECNEHRYCTPPGFCTTALDAQSISECVSHEETWYANAVARGCGVESATEIRCYQANGPFCTSADLDTACGVEAGRLTACLATRPAPDAGASASARSDDSDSF
jgi:hypothetical protein